MGLITQDGLDDFDLILLNSCYLPVCDNIYKNNYNFLDEDGVLGKR